MKAINLNILRKHWKTIIFVVTLFGYGGNELSKALQSESNHYQAVNEKAIKDYPKGDLTGWLVDVHFSKEDSTMNAGLPSIRYTRDIVLQNQYVVLPGVAPTSTLVGEALTSSIPDFKVESIFNIRLVSEVRKDNNTIDPKEPEKE